MKWKTILGIDIVLSIILSVVLMMRGVFAQNKLMCGIYTLADCGLKDWLIQLLIFFVVIFIIILILAGVLKARAGGGGIKGIGKIKMPKFKKEKIKKEKPMEKTPELGKDLELPADIEKEIGKIKI